MEVEKTGGFTGNPRLGWGLVREPLGNLWEFLGGKHVSLKTHDGLTL